MQVKQTNKLRQIELFAESIENAMYYLEVLRLKSETWLVLDIQPAIKPGDLSVNLPQINKDNDKVKLLQLKRTFKRYFASFFSNSGRYMFKRDQIDLTGL